mgnify:CR=1 FL=1
MIAVIKTGGKQYLVQEKDTIKIEKLPVEDRKGTTVTFTEVLLVSAKDGEATVGTPTVKGATVEATVVSDGKYPKVDIVKFKSKVRYRRHTGHRQPFTEVKIEKIIV